LASTGSTRRARATPAVGVRSMVMSRIRPAAVAAALLLGLAPRTADANPASEALRARGANQIYSLDHDGAMASFREAIAADPNDAAAYRGLATGFWLSITFRRGNMTVDDYLGRVSQAPTGGTPAKPEEAAGFRENLDKAITLAR